MDTAAFDYTLPPDRIAQTAIDPRDASRLLIAGDLSEIVFRDLATLFAPGDLLVVNRTRVRAARLAGIREDSGGKVEVFLTQANEDGTWQALLRPSRRLRSGVRVTVGDRTIDVLRDPVDGVSTVRIRPDDDIETFIDSVGSVPLPPYFRGELPDSERYQTIFADEVGSSAAPTAALHFTEGVVASLAAAGVAIAEVELRIGLDTFRPMASETIEDHTIHTERATVTRDVVDAVAATRASGGRVVAVGTTVARTLESAATAGGLVDEMDRPTDLFIRPGYEPRVIDGLITNFHAPRTTLIVLVAALLGNRWRTVYDHALASGFRFLSFGDAMYIEVSR
jgi:S-adenosylmethionine:tRNA ribosyltransferase-isomerase